MKLIITILILLNLGLNANQEKEQDCCISTENGYFCKKVIGACSMRWIYSEAEKADKSLFLTKEQLFQRLLPLKEVAQNKNN